jgi:hypothetical protein
VQPAFHAMNAALKARAERVRPDSMPAGSKLQ